MSLEVGALVEARVADGAALQLLTPRRWDCSVAVARLRGWRRHLRRGRDTGRRARRGRGCDRFSGRRRLRQLRRHRNFSPHRLHLGHCRCRPRHALSHLNDSPVRQPIVQLWVDLIPAPRNIDIQ